MSETDKELIASMSQIGKGGRAEVKIPGLDEMVDVSKISETQMELLRKEGMTDSDIYAQQLTVAEKANQYLAAMDAGIRLQIKKGGVSDKMVKRETLTQTIANSVPSLTEQDLEDLRNGDFSNIESKIEASAVKGADKALAELKKMTANDAIITPEGITTFDKGDILVAAQKANVHMGDEQSSGGINDALGKSITENNTNNNTNNNTTSLKGAKLELSGNINVNNGEGKMNGQDFLKLLAMDRGVALQASKLISDAMGQG